MIETPLAWLNLEDLWLPPETGTKILATIALLAVLWLLRTLACSVAKRRLDDLRQFYHWRRYIFYAYSILAILVVVRIWVKGVGSIATFLGARLLPGLFNTPWVSFWKEEYRCSRARRCGLTRTRKIKVESG